MRTEIHDLGALRAFVSRTGSLEGAVLQGLDLTGEDEALLAIAGRGAVFLGCAMTPALVAHAHATGALVFPELPALPYAPYRPHLYDPTELYAGYRRGEHDSWHETLDSRIYRHYDAQRRAGTPAILEALAQRLHDFSIDDALHDFLHPPGGDVRVVAIMGGHAMERASRAYADVARVARSLAEDGYVMASGGGPGAMEATHLGAWLAGRPDAALDEALGMLARAPKYHDEGWFDTALDVRDRFERGATPSLGIPTWFYGHEPANLFASHVAKYFSNSLREDGLLAIATHGVVYAPGSAGTIQEVFMDAAQNHYGTFAVVSPMVFLGVDAWTRDKPVFPLLERLAHGRQYGRVLTVTDDVDAAVAFVKGHPPVPYR